MSLLKGAADRGEQVGGVNIGGHAEFDRDRVITLVHHDAPPGLQRIAVGASDDDTLGFRQLVAMVITQPLPKRRDDFFFESP